MAPRGRKRCSGPNCGHCRLVAALTIFPGLIEDFYEFSAISDLLSTLPRWIESGTDLFPGLKNLQVFESELKAFRAEVLIYDYLIHQLDSMDSEGKIIPDESCCFHHPVLEFSVPWSFFGHFDEVRQCLRWLKGHYLEQDRGTLGQPFSLFPVVHGRVAGFGVRIPPVLYWCNGELAYVSLENASAESEPKSTAEIDDVNSPLDDMPEVDDYYSPDNLLLLTLGNVDAYSDKEWRYASHLILPASDNCTGVRAEYIGTFPDERFDLDESGIVSGIPRHIETPTQMEARLSRRQVRTIAQQYESQVSKTGPAIQDLSQYLISNYTLLQAEFDSTIHPPSESLNRLNLERSIEATRDAFEMQLDRGMMQAAYLERFSISMIGENLRQLSSGFERLALPNFHFHDVSFVVDCAMDSLLDFRRIWSKWNVTNEYLASLLYLLGGGEYPLLNEAYFDYFGIGNSIPDRLNDESSCREVLAAFFEEVVNRRDELKKVRSQLTHWGGGAALKPSGTWNRSLHDKGTTIFNLKKDSHLLHLHKGAWVATCLSDSRLLDLLIRASPTSKVDVP